MNEIKIAVNLNAGATVAVVGTAVVVCGSAAYVLSRPNAEELVKQIPATVSALPLARQQAEERRAVQLRAAGDVA